MKHELKCIDVSSKCIDTVDTLKNIYRNIDTVYFKKIYRCIDRYIDKLPTTNPDLFMLVLRTLNLATISSLFIIRIGEYRVHHARCRHRPLALSKRRFLNAPVLYLCKQSISTTVISTQHDSSILEKCFFEVQFPYPSLVHLRLNPRCDGGTSRLSDGIHFMGLGCYSYLCAFTGILIWNRFMECVGTFFI